MTDGPQQPAQDDTGHRETASGIGAPNVEPAGSRLDVLVAEKVFGEVRANAPCGDGLTRTNDFYAPTMREAEAQIRAAYAKSIAGGMKMWPAEYIGPSYSTDLAATALLIKHMQETAPLQKQILRLVVYPYSRTYAAFAMEPDDDEYSEGNGEHATEEAICRAALTSCSLPHDSTVGASTPATDAAADVPHETPDPQP